MNVFLPTPDVGFPPGTWMEGTDPLTRALIVAHVSVFPRVARGRQGGQGAKATRVWR